MIVSNPLPHAVPRHPAGSRARVLLSSVFGPYAQDDEYGSRAINPMELYHNQVTRVQGPFSLRMFHRSWGMMFIQANLEAPCTLLDFPTQERFIEELCSVPYDVVGIGSITINFLKVKRMCELVRQHQPQAKIVIGGHAANIPDLRQRLDADYIVRGEGVQWFREYLCDTQPRPYRHPLIQARVGARALGEEMPEHPRDRMATLIPSVGCPMGCNFCITSSMFGGKGHYYSFFRSGDELFEIMQNIEREMGATSFFVMDENFLLDRRRALRVLELMEQHQKLWTLYLFSSANAIRGYTIDQLVRLGVSWLWLGVEGENSQYGKLQGVDTLELVRKLRSHGIRVLGSTIIGLEEHTPENIDRVIERAVRHETDFHQFMLYMALPGTPLEQELAAAGRLLDEDQAPHHDRHGQYRFNFRHPHIPAGQESHYLLEAFRRDFAHNGPSMLRLVQTSLNGWRRYKDHPDARLRKRFQQEMKALAPIYAAAVYAAKRHYRDDLRIRGKLRALRDELVAECGRKARVWGLFGGRRLYESICAEQQRLEAGWTYEPPTFYEANPAAMALPHNGHVPQAARWVQAAASHHPAECVVADA